MYQAGSKHRFVNEMGYTLVTTVIVTMAVPAVVAAATKLHSTYSLLSYALPHSKKASSRGLAAGSCMPFSYPVITRLMRVIYGRRGG